MNNVMDISQVRRQFENLRKEFLLTDDETQCEEILDRIYQLDEQIGKFLQECVALHDEMDAFYEENLEEVEEEEGSDWVRTTPEEQEIR